jgi:hypothetical protein
MKRHDGAHDEDAGTENGTCLSEPAMKFGTASSHESDLTDNKHCPRREHGAM